MTVNLNKKATSHFARRIVHFLRINKNPTNALSHLRLPSLFASLNI